MKRGDVGIVAAPGDYGKPRPAVIVQSDRLSAVDSVIVCLISSDIAEAPLRRVSVQPNIQNGLRLPSQIMVDKLVALPSRRIGARIGALDASTMSALNSRLALVLGLAD